ncbi:MAG: hypothetical protein WCD37_14995 [Chloroflexia bacterium]
MTTGNMPNPPDRLTSMAPTEGARAQTQTEPEAGEPQQPLDLAGDIARIITEQADVLAQRLVYHTQLLFGVSAMAVDIVNARNSVLVVANAVRNRSEKQAVGTLVNVGTPQNAQINDGTLPFKNNSQVAGLLEGLILDTVSQAYRDDPARQREARLLLDTYSQSANEQLQGQSSALGPVMVQGSQGIGANPNARS